MLFNSAIAIPLFVTCGVIIPYHNIQGWLRVWLYQLNPWVRITSSMLTTELQYVSLPFGEKKPFSNHPFPIFPAVSKSPAGRKNSPSSTHLWARRAQPGPMTSFNTLADTWITRPKTHFVAIVPSRLGMSITLR